jgi:hypothetical protein
MAPAEAREPEAAAGVMEPAAARREPASQPQPVAADTGPSPDQPSPGAMEAPSPAVPIATRGEAAEAGGGTPETMPRPGVAAHHGGHGAAAERAPRVTPIAAARRPGIAPSGLAAEPLLSDQDIERILMDGLDPAEQQDIRDAVARTLRAAGHAVG